MEIIQIYIDEAEVKDIKLPNKIDAEVTARLGQEVLTNIKKEAYWIGVELVIQRIIKNKPNMSETEIAAMCEVDITFVKRVKEKIRRTSII